MEEMNNQILENQAMQTDQEMAMPAPEKKKLPLIIAAATAVGVIAAVIITLVALKAFKYKKAFKLIDDGEYLAAYELFESLGDYKDSKAQLNRFHYVPTKMTVTQYDDSYVTECYYDDNNFPRLIIETDLDDGDVFKGDFTYADDGKLTKIAYTDYDGTVSTVTFTYDKRGNTVSETFYSDNYSYTHLREYNEKNQLIKESEIYDDGEKYTVTYTYDARGNLIREVFESSYGSGSTTEYFYDDNNNMIKEIGPYETITYTYDANGNLILLAHSSGTNRVYTYDENGNLIREVQTSSYSDPDVFTYEYNSDGKLIKKTSNYVDKAYVDTYTYDSNGNLIKFVSEYVFDGPDESPDTTDVEYEFVYIPIDLTEEEFEEMYIQFILGYIY